MALRLVFAGTPEFAVPSVRAANERGEVVGVYTQPDRPAGRGRQMTLSPASIARWIGAAPRQRGSSEACTFQQPRRGIASTFGDRIRP